jgi:predicted nuclease of predicted toxin-antitoxin system
MNLLADENIDSAIVKYLRSLGHDVLWIVEYAPSTPDAEIISLAERRQRGILTFDRDFGELIFHSGRRAPGIILLRLDPEPPSTLLDSFRFLWPKLESGCQGHFIVATNKKIRVRPIPGV